MNRAQSILLSKFPKRRPALSPQHQVVFAKEYQINRTGTGLYQLVRRLESWMHRRVAERTGAGSLLELGAGGLNHVTYENGLQRYDVCEPLVELCEASSNRGLIAEIFPGYESLVPLVGARTYDRIASIAVLEHLEDLPFVIATAALLLKEDGVFQAGVPSEGGALWGLAWRSTTGVSYRLRTGLDYSVVMRHEHINDVDEIAGLISHFFAKVRLHRFPSLGKHLSLYTYIEAQRPVRDECVRFLARVASPRVAMSEQ